MPKNPQQFIQEVAPAPPKENGKRQPLRYYLDQQVPETTVAKAWKNA